MPDAPGVYLDPLQHLRLHARNHLQQAFQRTHLLDLLHRLQKVLEVELLTSEHLLFEPLPRLQVDRLLRLLDQPDDIPHLEDPARHALRIEDGQVFELLADADELDRHADHTVNRQCGAAAGIAVHLGQDHARDPDCLVKPLRDPDRFLSRHAVRDEQDLVRIELGLQPRELIHQLDIRLQPTGRVQQHVGAPFATRHIHGPGRDRDHVLLSRLVRHGNIDRLREDRELVSRRRTIRVAGYEQRPSSIPGQAQRQLPGRRRLSRALQPHEHHDGRRNSRFPKFRRRLAAQHLDQLVVHDLHDLLAGLDRLQDVLADSTLFDALEEVPGNVEIHVRFEQRPTNFAQALPQHRGRQDPSAAEAAKHTFQALAQLLEHPARSLSRALRPSDEIVPENQKTRRRVSALASVGRGVARRDPGVREPRSISGGSESGNARDRDPHDLVSSRAN